MSTKTLKKIKEKELLVYITTHSNENQSEATRRRLINSL